MDGLKYCLQVVEPAKSSSLKTPLSLTRRNISERARFLDRDTLLRIQHGEGKADTDTVCLCVKSNCIMTLLAVNITCMTDTDCWKRLQYSVIIICLPYFQITEGERKRERILCMY